MRIIVLGLIATVLFGVGMGARSRANTLRKRIDRTDRRGGGDVFRRGLDLRRAPRSGGTRRNWLNSVVERIADALPDGRRLCCPSAAPVLSSNGARSGLILPLLIGALLFVVIAPLSWNARNDPESTLQILVAILAMPMLSRYLWARVFKTRFLVDRPVTSRFLRRAASLATDEMGRDQDESGGSKCGDLMVAGARVPFGLGSRCGRTLNRLTRSEALSQVFGQSVYPLWPCSYSRPCSLRGDSW